MIKNRFLLVLGVLSLLLVTMAISRPFASSPVTAREGANDFYQRHPEWTRNVPYAAIPVTGAAEGSDFFQRHPELSLPALTTEGSDYAERHPELWRPATTVDLSDYFLRH